jgi:alpha-2-macroglobulin
VGVKIVKGEDRKTLIESGPARGWVRLPHPVAGRETVLEFRRKEKAADDPRIVVLMARQSFPPEADVFLRWGKGVLSGKGVATAEIQSLAFQTRPAFNVRFNCDREKKGAACIPLLPMTLRFSAPVARTKAKKIVLRGPGGTVFNAAFGGEDDGEDSFLHGVAFPGPFPEKAKFRIEIPPDLADDAGRPPQNREKFPLVVETDAYPVLAKFAAPFGIVEWNGGAALPVTLRNVEVQARTRMLEILDRKPDMGNQETGERDLARMKGRLHELRIGREDRIVDWLRRVTKAQSDRDRRGTSLLVGQGDVREFAVPKPGGEKGFEVVGIPFSKPGFYVVEIESSNLGRSLLGRGDPMYVPATALVTNLSAHFKKGRESSLVWVTSLDKGDPVVEADVAVRDPNSGKILWHGKTDTQGVARIRQALPKLQKSEGGWEFHGGYFVTARKGVDLTFVFSNWNEGIEPYRFNLPTMYRPDPIIGHTVFDRTLFRAGETVHMKHFLRRHSLDGLFTVEEGRLPKALLIRHTGSQERYEMPLKWAPDGSAEGEWTIPKEAKLGQYGVFLLYREPGEKEARNASGGSEEEDGETATPWRGERQTGSFRVEEYRVPLLKGIVSAPGGPNVDPGDVELDLLVSYLSGGGAGGAVVRLRTDLQPRNVSFPGYGTSSSPTGGSSKGSPGRSRATSSSRKRNTGRMRRNDRKREERQGGSPRSRRGNWSSTPPAHSGRT